MCRATHMSLGPSSGDFNSSTISCRIRLSIGWKICDGVHKTYRMEQKGGGGRLVQKSFFESLPFFVCNTKLMSLSYPEKSYLLAEFYILPASFAPLGPLKAIKTPTKSHYIFNSCFRLPIRSSYVRSSGSS